MERTKAVCNAHQGRERDAPAKPGWSCCLLILNNSVSLEDMTGKVLKNIWCKSHFPHSFLPANFGCDPVVHLLEMQMKVFSWNSKPCICLANSSGSKAGIHSNGENPVLGKTYEKYSINHGSTALECCRCVEPRKV